MLRFTPHYSQRPWGGTRFADSFARNVSGKIGESWELCEIETWHSPSELNSNEKLGDLWRAGKLGGSATGTFPFLLKWLDTSEVLSVQVHPDEATCQQLGSASPKTEAWFIAQADPDAYLLLGHTPELTQNNFRAAANNGEIGSFLERLQPSEGDLIYVPAGTLHAIGPGYLLLEVQQPSDTTFRVYDWQRPGLDGNLRELHIEQAAQSIRFDRNRRFEPVQVEVVGPCFKMTRLPLGAKIPGAGLRVFAAWKDTQLQHSRGRELLRPGDVVIAEPEDGEVRLASGEAIFLTES